MSEHHSEFTIKYYGYPLLYIDNICIEMALDVGEKDITDMWHAKVSKL